MKTYVLIIAFLFISLIGFSQSKKELQEQVTTLTSEKQKIVDEKLMLMEDILSLKQQILDLKTENLNCRAENDQLRNSISTNNAAVNNTPNAAWSTQDKSTLTSTGRCQAITAKGTQCSRMADPGSNYCWQHKSTYEPGSSSSTPSSVKSSNTISSGKTIYTGPRGGKYYINSHGNKTYVKKK